MPKETVSILQDASVDYQRCGDIKSKDTCNKKKHAREPRCPVWLRGAILGSLESPEAACGFSLLSGATWLPLGATAARGSTGLTRLRLLGASGATSGCLWVPGYLGRCLGLPKTTWATWVLPRAPWVAWGHLGLPWAVRGTGATWASGATLCFLGLPGATWGHAGHRGHLQHLGPPGDARATRG